MKQFNISYEHVATVDFDLLTAMCVISQIQLAARHHANTGAAREIAEAFARMLQQKVTEVAPENAAVLEMGWNPDFDTE